MGLDPFTIEEPIRFDPERFDRPDLLKQLDLVRWVICDQAKLEKGEAWPIVVAHKRAPKLRGTTRFVTLIEKRGTTITYRNATLIGDVESGDPLRVM